jgi:hypothetical protein
MRRVAMKQFVLGKSYPGMKGVTCICGTGPNQIRFHPDVENAIKFGTVEEALAFRQEMGHQVGGTDQYHVHEILPSGGLRDLGF